MEYLRQVDQGWRKMKKAMFRHPNLVIRRVMLYTHPSSSSSVPLLLFYFFNYLLSCEKIQNRKRAKKNVITLGRDEKTGMIYSSRMLFHI